jgi:hypothetical protein
VGVVLVVVGVVGVLVLVVVVAIKRGSPPPVSPQV